MNHLTKHAKRVALEIVGWTLVLLGIAALVLPGPGLILLAFGLLVLSQQYEWAERRLEPVREKALQGARDGVKTRPRIAVSMTLSVWLVALGALWIISPPAPQWWPLPDQWWCIGGWGTGTSLVLSGVVAAGLLIWSLKKFRWS